jgi:hypothetical protein
VPPEEVERVACDLYEQVRLSRADGATLLQGEREGRLTITLVLVHSPLVGPLTWSLVAGELRRRGFEAITPELPRGEDAGEPYWQQQARSVAAAIRAVPSDRAIILTGHSGAGPLQPAIRHAAGRSVAAYVFVDAGLPEDGQPRRGTGGFAQYLRELYARGERFPNWTDESLRDILPDPAVRQSLLAELRPQPWAFWEEPIPVFAGWPDAPCAYLRFTPNPAYDAAAVEARRRGWPCIELVGGHFHMLVDPGAVADALAELVRGMGRNKAPARDPSLRRATPVPDAITEPTDA